MRKAFTLMELMISIVLIVLITLFLYGAIASMKISNKTLAKHNTQESNRSKIFELIYRDIVESVSLKSTPTKDKHYNILELQTHNSIHTVVMPYVIYYVSREKDSLIRLEAAKKIKLPIAYDDRFSVYADILISNVDDFNIYTKNIDKNSSKENNASNSLNNDISASVLLYLKTKILQEPLLFELSI